MRSSIQRSRSVSGAGESGFVGAAFAGGLLVSLSSAKEVAGTAQEHNKVIASNQTDNFFSAGKRIFLS
jgi:hypothetical protein